MPALSQRFSGRAALLAGVALASLTTGALASDKPATPAGAKTISDFFTTYFGKAAGSPPALVVTPEGADYSVAIDIGALTTPMSGAGIGYGPAVLEYKVFEQEDGAWRVEQNELPPITSRSRQGDETIETSITATGAHFVTIIDPAISWFRSGHGAADKAVVHQTGPGLENTMELNSVTADSTGKATAGGAVSLEGHETIGPATMKLAIDPKAANPKAAANAVPVNFGMQSDKAQVAAKFDGLKVRPFLDLWAFLVAHPTREALAADEAAFKTLATSLLTSQLTLSEDGAAPKMTLQAQPGVFGIEGFKGNFAFAATGPSSRFEERFAIAKLTLPDGLVPAMYGDLVPTAFDIGVKVTGFDLNAAGTEAIADMRLAGKDPPISKADNEKVLAKLLGAGPLVIEIPPSHIVAPQLDLAIDGKITYVKGKPTGTVTLHMRNFDKTVTAMKSLGPEAEKQMLPALTMAKGLAKNDPDGRLTWVGEVGADGVMKVNGLPLGKAPF